MSTSDVYPVSDESGDWVSRHTMASPAPLTAANLMQKEAEETGRRIPWIEHLRVSSGIITSSGLLIGGGHDLDIGTAYGTSSTFDKILLSHEERLRTPFHTCMSKGSGLKGDFSHGPPTTCQNAMQKSSSSQLWHVSSRKELEKSQLWITVPRRNDSSIQEPSESVFGVSEEEEDMLLAYICGFESGSATQLFDKVQVESQAEGHHERESLHRHDDTESDIDEFPVTPEEEEFLRDVLKHPEQYETLKSAPNTTKATETSLTGAFRVEGVFKSLSANIPMFEYFREYRSF